MISALTLRRSVLGCVLAALVGLMVFVSGAGADTGVGVVAVEGQSFSGDVVSGLSCQLLSATITWGDGSTPSAGTTDGTGIQGTHTYADEGTYSGSVSYSYMPTNTCSDGTQTASFQATVQDAALSASGVDVSGTAGQSLSAVVAHVQDANPNAGAGDLSAQISWGDGTTSAGTVGNSTSGGFDVSGTHTYASAGTFAVKTSITDVGGSTASANSTAQIAGGTLPPPPPRVVPATIILSGPIGVTSDLQPRFVFTSTVAGSTFQCALDPGLHGAKWTACSTPYTTARLAAGKHFFEVRATSPAGVQDPVGAQRAFEIQPAASIEEHSCIKTSWDGPSIAASLVGGKGSMSCEFLFSCPEWYDCVLSGSLTFSFAMPASRAAFIDVPQQVFAALDLHSVTSNDNGLCVHDGDQYPQSGETRYCSRAGQIPFHGQGSVGPTGPTTPYVFCFAGSFVGIDPGDWFDSQVLGCHAVIRRTWAPGVAHAHPLINLVRRTANVFASSRAALDTGFVASCPVGGGTCAANVTAALAGTLRTGAASSKLQLKPPQPLVARTTLVGTRVLKIRAGRRARVTFSLTPRAAALLRKRHRLRITVTIATPPARLRGRDTVVKRTFTIVRRH